MRVLHAIASLDPERGGPPRSTLSLCVALARCGAEVRLLTSDVRGWAPGELSPAIPGAGDLRVVCAGGAAYLHRGLALSDWADVVHLQSIWKLRHALLADACHRKGVPYILAPRGELDTWSMRQKAWKKRVFLAGFGRRMIRRATALHVLNDDEARGIDALGIAHRRFVVPNGVDADEWRTPSPAPPVRERFPQVGARKLVLFFSRLHHKKGAALLAEAWVTIAGRYPDSFLLLAGPDYGERAVVERILADAALSSRSLVLDAQHGEERRRLLMDADIVALPSFQEGHPRVVLEAAVLGKSLLISRECHMPELADNDAAEVVDLTVQAVASGLARLLDDPARRRDLGARAAAVVLSQYTWPIVAERQMQVYRELTSDGRVRAAR